MGRAASPKVPTPAGAPVARPEVAAATRVVVKVGTRVLTGDDGHLALSRLFALVETAARLRRAGREVLVVSSGAVGLGRDALGLVEAPLELAERQACAAVGQCRLMALYDAGFSRLGLTCAQVLLTEGDFDDRARYLALRDTLSTLLRRGVVPVINENDTVATEELAISGASSSGRPVFGDNDRLAALVATKLGADLLLLATDVDGLFDRDPRRDDARLLDRVDDPEAIGLALPDARGGGAGRGGIRSKVESAWIAARSGCHAVIASGRRPGALDEALAGLRAGTWFPALPAALPARHRWLAFATAPRGRLRLDAGAVAALRERGASLLARGVTAVEGEFARGDAVDLVAPDGGRVGRGLVSCDADSARAWSAGHPPDGIRNHHALIHRDHLVLEP